MVSAQGKALITRTATGLGGLSIPDLLSLTPALVKSSALAMQGRLRHARQSLPHAPERLRRCQDRVTLQGDLLPVALELVIRGTGMLRAFPDVTSNTQTDNRRSDRPQIGLHCRAA